MIFLNLKDKYEQKIYCKGGGGFGGAFKKIEKGVKKGVKKIEKGASRMAGNLTGGLLGKSDAQRNQERMLEQAKEDAFRQEQQFSKQIAEENRRRKEEADRAEAEAKRAREEQARLLREAEEKRKAENDFNQRLAQDTGTIAKTNVDQNFNQQKTTTVDYSNSTNDFSKKEDDEDIDKLKKAFKRKL